MKLADFSVINYRSITAARKIQTNNMTVLVGKNNEGKSNILRALTLAMDIMRMYARDPRGLQISARHLKYHYIWERDYPLSLQEKHPNGASSIDLNFELTDREVAEIRNMTGIRISNFIPVRVSINNIAAKIDIPKKGTTAFSDVTKKRKIIEYVCFKIDFNFIPAVRTERDSQQVIEEIIERSLETLESEQEYIAATQTIENLQQKILNNISEQLINPLKQFLPTVKGVEIHIQKEQRRMALRRNTEIIIDDGVPTPINQKGDGIKSLMALAMLNMTSRTNRVSVIAIEEPESHLHPESARQLYETIMKLSEGHQVVLTTHSPIFVNRNNLNENIIVDQGKANPVKRIKEIREVLGTQVSDNLINAEIVLVVEGETDKMALEKLLPNMSDIIKKALQNGILIIDYIGGAGKLSYQLGLYRNLQCKYHVLLDNDESGKLSFEQAESQGLLTLKETTFTTCAGSVNSEIEDCFSKDVYINQIFEKFGVNINVNEFKSNRKWSDRMQACFVAQGKMWSSSIEKQVKILVTDALPEDASIALNSHKRSCIDSLVSALENILANRY